MAFCAINTIAADVFPDTHRDGKVCLRHRRQGGKILASWFASGGGSRAVGPKKISYPHPALLPKNPLPAGRPQLMVEFLPEPW